MVDGMAVSQLEPQSLRRQVGYVPQDVVLFHGDIRENILLGGGR
jgi:ATP-binding cassette subfamily C protein LapB